MSRKPNWHVFIADLKHLQTRAQALGLPLVARVLNVAEKVSGWEFSGDTDQAHKTLREEFKP